MITILMHEPRFKKHQALLRRVMAYGMKQEKCAKQSVTLVLTNDKEMRTLNHDYRGKNKATNVLAFVDGEDHHLGDIVLAYETIAKEAKAQGKTIADHLAHLALHGLLHLLGHDHEADAQAQRMEKREIQLLAALGVANPYRSH